MQDANKTGSFNLYRSSRPTPKYVSGQEHTTVFNLLETQRMPYFDATEHLNTKKGGTERKLILKECLNSKESLKVETEYSPVKEWRNRIELQTRSANRVSTTT